MIVNRIPPPSMGDVLQEEFMEPLHLSVTDLADTSRITISEMQDILHDKEPVTSVISKKLGIALGMSPKFFLNMQREIDRGKGQQR